MNLFASFAANNALWLLWYRLIIPHPDVINGNGVSGNKLAIKAQYRILYGNHVYSV